MAREIDAEIHDGAERGVFDREADAAEAEARRAAELRKRPPRPGSVVKRLDPRNAPARPPVVDLAAERRRAAGEAEAADARALEGRDGRFRLYFVDRHAWPPIDADDHVSDRLDSRPRNVSRERLFGPVAWAALCVSALVSIWAVVAIVDVVRSWAP